MNQKIIIGVMITGLLAGGIYLVINKKSREPSNQANPKSSTLTSNQSSADPAIANWKTYTNALYGFEFMYPSNLTVKTGSYSNATADSQTNHGFSIALDNDKRIKFLDITTKDDVTAIEKENDKCTGICYSLGVGSEEWAHELSLYNQTKLGSINCNYGILGFGSNWRDSYNCELATMGNNKFLVVYAPGGAPYGYPNKRYILYKSNVRYEFELADNHGTGEVQSKQEFESTTEMNSDGKLTKQIISTFKFTAQF